MTRLWRYKKKEEDEEEEDYNRYYVLFKESVMVFDDKEKTLQLLEKSEKGKEMPSRGPFRHFMEAEVVMKKKKEQEQEQEPVDVTHLLNQYDDGHGTFYHRLTNYTLTPADLYDFSQKKFILNADDTQTLTITPMDTLEPRAVSQFESIFSFSLS
jgi:hypothetical protein